METSYESIENATSALARERVLTDLQTLRRAAKDLVKATAGDMSEKAKEARARGRAALAQTCPPDSAGQGRVAPAEKAEVPMSRLPGETSFEMTETEVKVVAAWRQAATDLGIQFTSPFMLQRDGRTHECLGLVHRFGEREGTIISVNGEPSARTHLDAEEHFYFSELTAAHSEYRRRYFIETLYDWEFFGSHSERPSWYIESARG